MNVSIILISYNTIDLTRNCLKSIYEKTQGLDFEIFAVDNNSSDGSAEMIEKEFPEVKLIKNKENKGFGAANNIAIRLSCAEYVFLLNTDTILINNAVKEMFDFMEKNPDTAVCGGNLYNKELKPVLSCMTFPDAFNCTSICWLLKRIKNFEIREIKTETETDSVSGADMFIRKSVLDEIGLFDENIFMYGEEVDLCRRIKDKKYSVKILPSPKIIHLEGASSKNFFDNIKLRVKNKYYYVRKHNSKLCLYLMKISYCILHFICYVFTLNKNHFELLKLHFCG